MAAVHIQQDDVPPTPSSHQQTERMSPRAMHYYLTEGLEGVERKGYRDIRTFKQAVDSRVEMVRSGKVDECPTTPYLFFCPVTQKQLANIERARRDRYKTLRFLYLNEPQTLIVKIFPGQVHELVVDEFVFTLRKEIEAKGQGEKICSMRSSTFKGLECSKQADGALRPVVARPDVYGWPSVVFECGVTESPRRLACDARWWFHNSKGAVKMVIIFFVSASTKTVTIEIWERARMENASVTQGNDGDGDEVDLPVVKETTTINAKNVSSTLTFRFKAIFLRAPRKKRGEGDYTLTEGDLRDYYDRVWSDVMDTSSESEEGKPILVMACLSSS